MRAGRDDAERAAEGELEAAPEREGGDGAYARDGEGGERGEGCAEGGEEGAGPWRG